MPSQPFRFCRHAGCREIVQGGGKCPKHVSDPMQRPKWVDTRPNPELRGYDWKWKKARNEFLSFHRHCAMCGEKANVVDHIRAAKGDDGLFWDRGNWQALCRSCHSSKTNSRDGGLGNRVKRTGTYGR